MNVLLGLCLFFGITLACDVNAGICFIGDPSCTQGKIISLYTEQKECTYVDKNACEKYNRNSYCKIDNKDKCYKPSECKVGYYKHTDDICSIGSYSHLIDIDNFGCGLPITNGGRDCGAVGYGAIYDEFGFSKQTLVFNVDSEKIDCYAAISQENCQKASPHGVCEQDKCGNWHVTKCAEGYGFYWRNESGCELGIDLNAEEGDAVCQKCLGCKYASKEECEEDKGNEHSACEVDETDGCVKPRGCKKGFVSVDDNSEICKLGTYMELLDIDNNGCGVPGTEGSGGGSPYIECLMGGADGLPGFECLPIARGNYMDDDYSEIDSLNDWFRIVPEEEGAFDTQQNCEITTERGTRKCKADACGRWIWSHAVCNDGYVFGGGTCPDGLKRADQNYDGTGCWKCENECEYASKKECEDNEDNMYSVCEIDEADGCYKPIGCRVMDKDSEMAITATECPDKYIPTSDKDKNGCYMCERCYSKTECKEKNFNSICEIWKDDCYEPAMRCEDGYTYHHIGGGGYVKETCDYNNCCCNYITLDACKKDNYNSVCQKLNDECYGPVGCKDGAKHTTSYRDRPKKTDKNGCYFECDEEIQNICIGYPYPDEYPNSKCVTDEFNCKVLECKVGYNKKCSDGFVLDNIDNNGCGKCIQDEPVECEYKDKTACQTENFHSVCENVNGCWKATKCNKWSTTCEEYCKNGKCSLIDADKNGCAEMLYCFGG